MPTAWPTTTRAEFDPNKAVRTSRVAALVARDEVLREQPFVIYFSNKTATTLAKVATVTIQNYDAAVGKKLSINLSCYVSAGTGTWYTVIGSSQSSNVSVTNTGSAARSGPPSPNLSVFPALVNTLGAPEPVTIEIWGSCSGGTLNIAGQYDSWCWLED